MIEERDDMQDEDRTAVSPEEEDGTPVSPDDKMRILQQALQQRTAELEEIREKYLRTAADFDNFRKRKQREIEEFRKYANEQLASELLGVVDHLGLALRHAGEMGETVQGMLQGVELVYKQFLDVLEKAGVKRFVAAGEPFDPVRHDALMQVVTDDVPENTVVQVMQEGYLYHDKVLRHAKVGVSKRSGDGQHPEPAGEAAPQAGP